MWRSSYGVGLVFPMISEYIALGCMTYHVDMSADYTLPCWVVEIKTIRDQMHIESLIYSVMNSTTASGTKFSTYNTFAIQPNWQHRKYINPTSKPQIKSYHHTSWRGRFHDPAYSSGSASWSWVNEYLVPRLSAVSGAA